MFLACGFGKCVNNIFVYVILSKAIIFLYTCSLYNNVYAKILYIFLAIKILDVCISISPFPSPSVYV